MFEKTLVLFLAPALLLASACDSPDPDADGSADEGAVQLRPGPNNGGVWLNTSHMNIDEVDTAKVMHDGVTLRHVKIKVGNKLQTLDQVWSADGELRGKIGAQTFTGGAFLNAEMRVYNHQYGADVDVKVTSYTPGQPGHPPSYQLKQNYFGGQVVYVCNREDTVGPYESYLFGDMSVQETTGDIVARANTLYLGCHKGAVGKAGTWGYFPWDLGLADFEAVVRAVRADYCGNGVSYTHPGVAVSVRDVWGVNDFAPTTGATEAVWGPEGALCIGQPRDASVSPSTILCDGAPLPTCPADVSLETYPDALLWVKTVPAV